MISFKQKYYETLYLAFVKELAESGMAISPEINEPLLSMIESSLYKALDLTFAELDKDFKDGKV